jgi:hypothetical protein
MSENVIEKIDYGDIEISYIIKIFGDEMSYNDLNFYIQKDEYIHLIVEFNRNNETKLVRVYFDNKVIMDKKYSIYHSCDMFFYLSEIEKF